MKKLFFFSLILSLLLALTSPATGANITSWIEHATIPEHTGQMQRSIAYKVIYITVEKGDWLSTIVNKINQENDIELTWQTLYKINKDVIGPDPNLIVPGMELTYKTTVAHRGPVILM